MSNKVLSGNEFEIKKNDDTAKIVICYPVITGNGSKHIATNLSYAYKSTHPQERVALVDLDVHHAHICEQQIASDKLHGIDNLLDKIDGEQLSKELFRENMIKLKSGVDFLKGTQLKKEFAIICRHHIEEIFLHLRDSYDKVFISVSNRNDNAGTIYGLYLADEVILVAKNNYANFVKLEEGFETVTRYYHKENAIKIIINQYNAKSNINLGVWISEHPVEALGMIPYDENTSDGMDLQTSFLNQSGRKRGNKTIVMYEQILNELFPVKKEG